MKNIFLDTNFIIDYFVREDFNGEAEKLLQLGESLNLIFLSPIFLLLILHILCVSYQPVN